MSDTRYYGADGKLKWGYPVDVGHLILQLQTLDASMKVSAVTHIEIDGRTRARAFGLSMSRERWDEGGWLNYLLPGPEALAIWASTRDEGLEGLSSLEQQVESLRAENQRLTSQLAEADFGYGGWDSIRGRLTKERDALLADKERLRDLLNQAGGMLSLIIQSGGIKWAHPSGSTVEIQGTDVLLELIRKELSDAARKPVSQEPK